MSRFASAFLSLLAGAAASALPSVANAAPFSSDSYSQCAPLAAGVSRVFIDGGEYEYAYGGSVPVGEIGYGLCGPYLEFGLRARFNAMSHFFLASPAITMRVHTRTPNGAGLEAGLGLRLGVHFLHASTPPSRTPYSADGAGGFAAIGPDVRLWLGEHWGLTAGVDLSVGSAIGHPVAALSVTTGGMVRW